MTADIIDRKLLEWTHGMSAKDARIAIFYKIRDIPYAVLPELNHSERFVDILKLNKGSCTPKHHHRNKACVLNQAVAVLHTHAYPRIPTHLRVK